MATFEKRGLGLSGLKKQSRIGEDPGSSLYSSLPLRLKENQSGSKIELSHYSKYIVFLFAKTRKTRYTVLTIKRRVIPLSSAYH